jgi:diguanylate cyclase (GGDEF)-like protein
MTQKVDNYSRLDAIGKIHHAVGASLELPEIARIVVRILMEVLQCDGCAFLMIEDNGIDLLAEHGFKKNFKNLKINTDLPIIKEILDHKREILVGDTKSAPVGVCIPDGCNMKTLICLPIVINEKVKAILHLDSLKPYAFNESDIELARIAAREIALAVERAIKFKEVLELTLKDTLTGAYNRRKLDVDLPALLADARIRHLPLSYMMLDLDLFKQFNECYGHAAGDKALKTLVTIIKEKLRAGDFVYRCGGEEFAVIMQNTPAFVAQAVADRLRTAIAGSFLRTDGKPCLSISVGIASYPENTVESHLLMSMADDALYQAKQKGRNQVIGYGSGNKKDSQFKLSGTSTEF